METCGTRAHRFSHGDNAMKKNNKRKTIPGSVRQRMHQQGHDMTKVCAVCNNPLFGLFEIAHVRATVLGGDLEPVRKFVGLCPYCNTTENRNYVDLSSVDMSMIIYDSYGV